MRKINIKNQIINNPFEKQPGVIIEDENVEN
jgi:hypothetical protein